MSETAKTLKYPAACSGTACGKLLAGPVHYCPFCGTAVQRAAPTLRVVPPVPVPPVVSAPAGQDEQPDLSAPAVAPQAIPISPEPTSATTAPHVTATPPGRHKGKIALALAVLAGVASYGLYQVVGTHDQQQIERALATGKTCMANQDYRCAIENADDVLKNDRNEPRALSLKQQAQDELARAQKAADLQQARLQAEAAQKAAYEQARQMRAEQQEREAQRRAEEQQRMAQAQREQDLEAQRQQAIRAREQQLRAQQRAAQQPRAVNSGSYTAPPDAFNRPNGFGSRSGSSTDDIIRQGQQMQQFQKQQQQRQPQGQQQNKEVIRSIIN